MAAQNLLSDTINYITPFCRYMSANVGVSNQPILGIASLVRNIILAAPFQWSWNRIYDDSVVTVVGQQDYTPDLYNFGYLEKASVQNAAGQIWEIPRIKNNEPLAKSTQQARPDALAVQINNSGTDEPSSFLTLRFSAVPDAIYQVNLIYQEAPYNFTALSNPWAPVPDSFSDVYNNMVLGYYMDSCQDGRAQQYVARGVAGLLARAQGLTEMDKALFAASYMQFDMQQMLSKLRTQQGQQAQGQR